MFGKFQGYAKFIVAMLGAAVASGSLLIPEEWGKWITFVVAILTAFSVYQVSNDPRTKDQREADLQARYANDGADPYGNTYE